VSDPFRQLAAELERRMAGKAAGALAGIPCELGTITSSGLKLDSFKHEIRDYLVADWLAKIHLPAFTVSGTQTGLEDSLGGSVVGTANWSCQPAEIDEVHVEVLPDLKPGDRVLAIPVNGGQDVIVICKVVPNG